MSFLNRLPSDSHPLPTSNLGRLHQDRVHLLSRLSCVVARGEDIDSQLNSIKCRLELAEDNDDTCFKKILKKRVRTLTFQVAQCRKTADTLTANLNIVTEQIRHMEQHHWNNLQQSYMQYSNPDSPQTLGGELTEFQSSFVAFSPTFPLVISPISYDQAVQTFCPSPVFMSPITPSLASTTWSQWSESDRSDISDPNSPRMDLRGMPVYQIHSPQSYSSDSCSSPSSCYTEFSSRSPVIWQNWSFGPSLHSTPQTPIGLISPMTSMNVGNIRWSPEPLRAPVYSPEPTSNAVLKRSKFQWQNFPKTNESSSKASPLVPSKFRWSQNSSIAQATIILQPAPLPKSHVTKTSTAPAKAVSNSEAKPLPTLGRKRSTSHTSEVLSNEDDGFGPGKGMHRSRSRSC